ncbi:P-loop containing nucleoside triphosphate hydrolase protein [Hymenopellis radicata]|nr:P-loop containing nucleoside triphosphate hydrolase protein [Hymenopellis radicata]
MADKPDLRQLYVRHINIILVVTFAIYAYRDLVPLTTYTHLPQDIGEGRLLWAKVAVLAITGLVIPLFIPREYVPVDADNPAPVPNIEQITPLISLVFFFWLDPVISAAYRLAHFPYEQLPPLADYDASKHLKQKSFKYLDLFSGARRRNVGFGLVRYFAKDYAVLIIMMIIQVCADFAAPVGVNRLLSYLENNGREPVEYRPWLWITWLFVGPMISSLAFDWYIFIATRIIVRCQAILTELVFEHALRIRVVADSASPAPADEEETKNGADSDNAAIESESNSESAPSEDTTLQASSSSTKSKASSKTAPSSPAQDEVKNLVGRINNLVTTDMSNIVWGLHTIREVVYTPLNVIFCIGFLYVVLGWSSFVGLGVIVVMAPLPGYLAKVMQGVQVETLKKTDARVQAVTEIMNVVRMIKLFGWERRMEERVGEKRDDELKWVIKRRKLNLAIGLLNFAIPLLTMMATFATYMTIFSMFGQQFMNLLACFNEVTAAKASLDRLTAFLHDTELLDRFASEEHQVPVITIGDAIPTPDTLGLGHAMFSWSNVSGKGNNNFILHINENVIFRRNCVNLIVGPTGSGKTSLLMALLGEMHCIRSDPGAWFNLPRRGGVAYAAQESWVLNATIRENILFGAAFDEERYKRVIYQCGLERDLELFDAGDKTEVGEKGLTLSGGQKARVTLARAVYSAAEVIILDDVLAALDVHTAKWIVEKCFQGDLVKNRTIVLVTHNVFMVKPIAEFVVSLKDGRVESQGSLSSALAKNQVLVQEAEEDAEAMQRDDEVTDDAAETTPATTKSDGKLIMAEEINEGHLSWSALKLYLSALGGDHAVLVFGGYLGGVIAQSVANNGQTWYMGYWASQYDTHDAADVSAVRYLGGYALLILAVFSFYLIANTVWMFAAIRASRTINRVLVTSVLGATLRWLDTTPTSRVITRCTQDIRAVDGPLADGLMLLTTLAMSMLIKFGAVVLVTPAFLLPGLAVAVLGNFIGQVYIKAQLSVKREMSNAKAPVLAHFGAAISGLTSLRAYGAQEAFKAESLRRIDKLTRVSRTFYNLNRWVNIRINLLGSLFSTLVAAYLVYALDRRAYHVGFSLAMIISFNSMILVFVRMLNEFEINGNRGEEQPRKEGIPPAYWPASGKVRVEGLCARYSRDGPRVLHDLSFEIRSGKGLVLSSLTLSLLRCIYTEGEVYYDDISTKSINLDALRANITIIPQLPELLSGTLRQNLDPFEQCDDATLNDALRSAGLFALQQDSDSSEGSNTSTLTLDSAISSAGANVSVGQRQILALARALVRGSKLLILDEATSAIDYKTDSVIQASLRHELGKDVTLVVIAHRLQTVMDADRIMVLDAGRIVEFDTPGALLGKTNGRLRALVDESADRDALCAMPSLLVKRRRLDEVSLSSSGVLSVWRVHVLGRRRWI